MGNPRDRLEPAWPVAPSSVLELGLVDPLEPAVPPVARQSVGASPLVPGYRLDRYELLAPLATGGMASVWLARQRGRDGHGFDRLVAVKTILPQLAEDERFRRMFLDEARIALRIEHVNVTRVLELGEAGDVLYLVMEYVDGDSLSKLQRDCRKAGVTIPPGIVMRILADACSGLHAAHERRGEDGRLLDVVHRDVSPQNLLVSTRGVTKVIDFGVARARNRIADETSAGTLKGKIRYMAPEQALGGSVDRRADVWGVGATLYRLLAGKPPYRAESTLEILKVLTSGRPPPPLPPSIHPAIASVASRALVIPVGARFETAARMREAMEDALIEAGIPTTSDDVASFVAAHLASAAERRHIVDLALAAADERQRLGRRLAPKAAPAAQSQQAGSRTHTPASDQTLLGTVASKDTSPAAAPWRWAAAIGALTGLGLAAAVVELVPDLARRALAPFVAPPAASWSPLSTGAPSGAAPPEPSAASMSSSMRGLMPEPSPVMSAGSAQGAAVSAAPQGMRPRRPGMRNNK